MCIIVVKPSNKVITRRTLKNCFTSNSDGAGLMFSVDGALVIDKGYFGFRAFYKRFRSYERAHPNANFVLHFRIATSGGIHVSTCHPFRVHKTLGFVHNGIFSGLGTKYLSDTQIFNINILQKLPPNFMDIDRARKQISDYIVTSLSKVVFLDNEGNYTIVNESNGHWDEGIWYSNYGYLPASYYTGKYYDDGYYTDYANAYNTKKRCLICSCWTDIEKIDWINNISFEGKTQNGWVCNFCNDFINAIHDCNGCGQSKPRKELYRNQYGEMICDECILLDSNSLIDYATSGYGNNDSVECYDCGSPNIVYQADRGGYLCGSCYKRTSIGIQGAKGTCPVCNTIVHIQEKDAYRCPHCQVYLDKDEYLENVNDNEKI
jgi:glutamine amidotransferase